MLHDYGMIICKFGSDGIQTVSNGSTITLNTISTMNGFKHELVSSKYENCLTATFQICKNLCGLNQREEITTDELRNIMKWLNRKSFHKLRFIDDEHINIYFEATFNVNKIEFNGRVYGLELEMITNRPFALHEPITLQVKNINTNGVKKIYSKSDDEGYIYPEMEITIDSDGDLEIHNSLENRTMRIANCKAGEVIKINYPMIESSNDKHKINNDFNWNFFRIATTFRDKENVLTISIPCTIKMKYSPVVKIGI
jgi:hypothetical protein